MSSYPEALSRPWRLAEAGVTITELMVVIGIIAIASTMAMPNYLAWNARYQLRQAVSELHGNVSLARMAAMNRNTSVTVQLAAAVVDPEDGKAKVTATFTDANGATVMAAQRMKTEIQNFGGAAQVRFNSLGLRIGGGAGVQTITLSNSQGLTYEMQVTAGGKSRWCAMSPCP
jgi:type IV fimbrial biogenesis protein FimT